MRCHNQAHGRQSVGLLLLLLASVATAQDITPTVQRPPDPVRCSLSEPIRITIAFDAPAPIRVELPDKLLTPQTHRDWQIRPIGPAVVTPSKPGRERWSRPYRLDPFVSGEFVVLFADVTVNGEKTQPPGFEVRVQPPAVEAKPENARPVTGIEELPPLVDSPTSTSPWVWALAGFAFAVVVASALWLTRRRPKPILPGDWATSAFDRLERDGTSGVALVEAVAAVVRGFIDRRFGIPAPQLTTGELLAQQHGWSVEQTDGLRRLLEVCDRAKFAGDVPDDGGCRGLLAAARAWACGVPPDRPAD